MEFGIIVSSKDLAGLNIKNSLLELGFEPDGEFDDSQVYKLGNAKLYTVKKDSVDCENLDQEIQADLFIFATKHESKAQISSLSVHTQGNWGEAMMGGKDNELAVAPALHLKKALNKLNELGKDTQFEIIQECTHHGPYIEKPSMFIEIGSSEEHWNDKTAANIIAKTILDLISSEPKQYQTAVGIGGLHHTPSFKKIILNSEIAIGHVCPKYKLDDLNLELLGQAINRTIPKADLIILDWKGLGPYKEKIKHITDQTDLEIKRTKEF